MFPIPLLAKIKRFTCDRKLFQVYAWQQRNDSEENKKIYEERKMKCMKETEAHDQMVVISMVIESSVESSFQFFMQTAFVMPTLILAFTGTSGSTNLEDVFNLRTLSILSSFLSFAMAFYSIR